MFKRIDHAEIIPADVEKCLDFRVRGRGVKITVEPMDIGASIRGEIMDPDGFMVELRQWK